jgi:hypothetical protein
MLSIREPIDPPFVRCTCLAFYATFLAGPHMGRVGTGKCQGGELVPGMRTRNSVMRAWRGGLSHAPAVRASNGLIPQASRSTSYGVRRYIR